MKNIQTEIFKASQEAHNSNATFAKLFDNPNLQSKQNDFLFFIKPEITNNISNINFDGILDLIFWKFSEFNFEIKKVVLIGSSYLKQYNIISEHYGVINKIASNARDNLSESARNKFKEIYGFDFLDGNIQGGIEFINKYNEFTPLTLDILWQNKINQKLAGGTYCEDVKIDGEKIYLINGFHPRQVAHFTDEGRFIIAFHLTSNTNWADARQKFIGLTNPEKAEEGSIRKELFINKDSYKLPEVSQGMNGVHLSAGPVEGLIELVRYFSDFSNPEDNVNFRDFDFGKKLIETFGEEIANLILSNPNITVNGKQISIFDLTEEQNSDETIQLLKQNILLLQKEG